MKNSWKITIDGSLPIWLIIAVYHSYGNLHWSRYTCGIHYIAYGVVRVTLFKSRYEMNFEKDDNL